MPDQTLPERLRDLADRLEGAQSDGTWSLESPDALRGAADELERLARPMLAPGTLAGHLAEFAGDLEQYGADLTGLPESGALVRDAADALARLGRDLADAERGRDYYSEVAARLAEQARHPLHVIGRELAGDAGVASPMPQPRRFAARYADAVTGRLFAVPAPGSFVLLGPVGSTWRVLAVDELAGHGSATHVLDLEAVDAHDVPVQARVEAVPMPVEEFEPAEVTA